MKLLGKDGKDVFVNPAHVTLVEASKNDEGHTVVFVSGFATTVQGEPAEIAEKLGHA